MQRDGVSQTKLPRSKSNACSHGQEERLPIQGKDRPQHRTLTQFK